MFDAGKPLPDEVLESLKSRFGNRVSQSDAMRERFGKDESFHPSIPPDAVVTVHDTDEVAFVVTLCNEHRIPLIPYGAGTSLEGNVAALHGGICLNMQEMNQVLVVNQEDLNVVVQPGLVKCL